MSFRSLLLQALLKQSGVKWSEQILLYLVGLKSALLTAASHFLHRRGLVSGNLWEEVENKSTINKNSNTAKIQYDLISYSVQHKTRSICFPWMNVYRSALFLYEIHSKPWCMMKTIPIFKMKYPETLVMGWA